MKDLIRNKELSWLAFNERVLQEAEKDDVPLIERVKFLGIYSNNLDEFFRVRVAILQRLAVIKREYDDKHKDPKHLIKLIQDKVNKMGEKFAIVSKKILDDLKAEKIYLIDESKLDDEQAQFVSDYFQNVVRPRIFPLLLKKKLELPTLKDDAFYLAVNIEPKHKKSNKFSIIEVPTDVLPRFIQLSGSGDKTFIIRLEDIIRKHLPDIYYMLDIKKIQAHTFKVTRDAELDINDDVDMAYSAAIERSLERRKAAPAVRLVYDKDMPDETLELLQSKLGYGDESTIIAGGRYHNSKDFMSFPNLGHKDLLYKPMPGLQHKDLPRATSIIQVIKEKDVLLHFPYQSFTQFIDLLREAAIDSAVKEIKMTIYRVAKNSAVIDALINAAQNGKKVTVVMELQARFDEEANLQWSEQLKNENIEVIYGVDELKVHSKLVLIVREENKVDVNYACIGTGNFNEDTANVFSDHLLITSKPGITNEVADVFNFFKRNYNIKRPKYLLVSPFFFRNRFVRMINREIRNAAAGKPAFIYIKTNNLVDDALILKLYEAKRKGVDVRLNVRGMFSVMPEAPIKHGHIPSIALIDRFLEHSRLFFFCNDGDEVIYLSSADLMQRNMDRRVETAVPILDEELKKELHTMWDYQWKDNSAARILNDNLDNEIRKSDQETEFKSQERFYHYLKKKHNA